MNNPPGTHGSEACWTDNAERSGFGLLTILHTTRSALNRLRWSSVGKIVFRLTDLEGKTLGEFEAKPQSMQSDANFTKAVANWPTDVAPPGGHHVMAIVYDKQGKELTRIAPRLVSTSMQQGY